MPEDRPLIGLRRGVIGLHYGLKLRWIRFDSESRMKISVDDWLYLSGVRRVWNDVFVSPPVLELFPRCFPKLYPVFLIAVTWLLPWRSAGVSWSWVDLQHLYWRG